jgi:hypothetical protein
MARGDVDSALGQYQKNVDRSEDKLLRLMDEGLLLRTAGRWQESNQKFFEAARIIELNGYLDVGEETLSLLTNEQQTTYQGEDFEKVLVHLYLGLNFLELGERDSALVEMRKVNEILELMKREGNRAYELNAFARYLGACLFEDDREFNDARVAYLQTQKLAPHLVTQGKLLQIDRLRMALRLGFEEELQELSKEWGKEVLEEARQTLRERKGALLLLFEAGKSPMKKSTKEYHTTTGKGGSLIEVMIPTPYYVDRPTRIASARLVVEEISSEDSIPFFDVESTARQHLKDRMGRIAARALASAVAKAAVATGVGAASGSKDLGVLVGIGLLLTSQADTRSWLLLPANYQVAKLWLKPGRYSGKIRYLDVYGSIVEEEALDDFEIKAASHTPLQRRRFH